MTKTTASKNKSSSSGLSNYYNLSHHSSTKRKFAGGKAVVIVIILLVVLVGIPLMIGRIKRNAEEEALSLPNLKISETKNPKDLGYDYDDNGYRSVAYGDEISMYMRQATVAAEDREFYNFDGAALPQKVIECVYVNPSEREKRTEAKELESMYSKEEIITMYLNSCPYIDNIREIGGIENGAHVYFGKSAADLNLAEAAFLAAIPSSSTTLSPYNEHDHDELTERQHEILGVMVDMGYITSDEAEAAKAVNIFSAIKPKLKAQPTE